MSQRDSEIEKRRLRAVAAIRDSFESESEDGSVALFISHHLSELGPDYWSRHTQTSSPSYREVLDLLTLRSHWSDEEEDGLEVFDFTLPDDATNYVLSVRFDDAGEIDSIDMES